MNDRRYVFHFRPKPNIWPEKHLALGRIPKPKPNVQIYVNIFFRFSIKTIQFPSFFLGIESSRVGGNGSGDGDLVSPNSSHHVRRPSKASSLADDILAIRAALDGASASARERTLKTLERLTERLALAESERDMALGKLVENIIKIN